MPAQLIQGKHCRGRKWYKREWKKNTIIERTGSSGICQTVLLIIFMIGCLFLAKDVFVFQCKGSGCINEDNENITKTIVHSYDEEYKLKNFWHLFNNSKLQVLLFSVPYNESNVRRKEHNHNHDCEESSKIASNKQNRADFNPSKTFLPTTARTKDNKPDVLENSIVVETRNNENHTSNTIVIHFMGRALESDILEFPFANTIITSLPMISSTAMYDEDNTSCDRCSNYNKLEELGALEKSDADFIIATISSERKENMHKYESTTSYTLATALSTIYGNQTTESSVETTINGPTTDPHPTEGWFGESDVREHTTVYDTSASTVSLSYHIQTSLSSTLQRSDIFTDDIPQTYYNDAAKISIKLIPTDSTNEIKTELDKDLLDENNIKDHTKIVENIHTHSIDWIITDPTVPYVRENTSSYEDIYESSIPDSSYIETSVSETDTGSIFPIYDNAITEINLLLIRNNSSRITQPKPVDNVWISENNLRENTNIYEDIRIPSFVDSKYIGYSVPTTLQLSSMESFLNTVSSIYDNITTDRSIYSIINDPNSTKQLKVGTDKFNESSVSETQTTYDEIRLSSIPDINIATSISSTLVNSDTDTTINVITLIPSNFTENEYDWASTPLMKYDESNIDVIFYDMILSYNTTNLWGQISLTMQFSTTMDKVILQFDGNDVFNLTIFKIKKTDLSEELLKINVKNVVYDKERRRIIIKVVDKMKQGNSYIFRMNFTSPLNRFEKGANLMIYAPRKVDIHMSGKQRFNLKEDLDDFEMTPEIPISSFMFYILPEYDSVTIKRTNTPSLIVWYPPYLRYSIDPLVYISLSVLDFFYEYFQYNMPLQQISIVICESLYSDPPASFGSIAMSSKFLYEKFNGKYENTENLYFYIAKQFCDLWMGNIVNFNSRNDYWIKEGFSMYMAHLAAYQIYPDYDFSSFIKRILSSAFQYHRFSHLRIHNNLHNANDRISSGTPFKAAFLFHMVYNILKPSTFKEGVQVFFEKWALMNIKPENLWNSFDIVQGNINITQFVRSWSIYYYPTINVGLGSNVVIIEQIPNPSSQDGLGSWWIPINYVTGHDLYFDYTITRWLKQEKRIQININLNQSWIIVNPKYSAFYRTNYTENLWKVLSTELRQRPSKLPSSVKAQILDDAFTLASDGMLDYSVPMTMALYLVHEEEYAPWVVALKHFSDMTEFLIDYPEWQLFQKYMATIMMRITQKLGLERKNERTINGHLRKLLLTWSCLNDLPNGCSVWANHKFEKWSNNITFLSKNEIPVELRSIVYCMGAKIGGEGATKFLYDFSKVPMITPDEEMRLLRAVTCTDGHKAFIEILKDILNIYNPLFSLLRLKEFCQSLWQSHKNSLLTFQYVKYNWVTIYKRFRGENEILRVIMEGSTCFLRSKYHLNEVLKLRDYIPQNDYSLLTTFDYAIDQIGYNINWEAKNLVPIRKWLRYYQKNTPE